MGPTLVWYLLGVGTAAVEAEPMVGMSSASAVVASGAGTMTAAVAGKAATVVVVGGAAAAAAGPRLEKERRWRGWEE